MKRRTKAPRGYSARRISLIDSGPQLSRQLLGCIPAHRPIYIQHGLHKTIGIPLVRCTLALPIPTRRVGIVLEYDNNHTYSIVHARKRHLSHRDRSTRCSQFPIFNCKPFQLNTCLYRQSLRFSSFLSSSTPCLPPHHALRPSYKVCIESHEAIPAMQQFRLLAGSNPKNSVQARTACFTSHGVRSLAPSGDTHTYAQFLSI